MTNSAAPVPPAPPRAAQKPARSEHHGVVLEDPWAWLKDPNYPKVEDAEVLAYLKAENAYFEAVMAPERPLIEAVYQELRGRIKEDDESVPSKDGSFLYHWRFESGVEYRAWYRQPVSGGARELLLDEAALAKGVEYFQLGSLDVSPNAKLMAYATDTTGSERLTMRVRDLASLAELPDVIEETQGGAVWSADSAGFFYTLVNENWRPYVVKYHRLGSDPATDPTVYEESDTGFFVSVGLTQSRNFVVISTADHVTSEHYLIPAHAPLEPPRLISKRQVNRMYDVDEREGTLYILTNDTHVNFRVATASVENPGEWQELIAGSDRHYLRDLTAFKHFLVVEERIDGLDQIRVRDAAGTEHYIAFPESTYTASVGTNPEYDVTTMRLSYESLVTPRTVYDYELEQRSLEVLKVQQIPSGYDKTQYDSVRLMAPARDGVRVPVSVVFKKGFPRDGSGPLMLYSYGAYGHAVPPGFSSARLSLLDRGFAFAIAHIRGGDDLGYQWYLDGKLERRENTFRDFVDVGKYLVEQRFAARGGIAISGGSAGGTLVGVAANLAPELWRAVVAHVPFVDVLNTMLDDSLPLTPMEWPEWGNPITDANAFRTIAAYSPYDHVAAKPYPAILITAGLNDPRVTYWEPAKWAAKLRALKTDSNLLLLKTNMGAGHGGKSGRFERLREVAEEYAFVLRAFGKS
ncbi:MAG TPA: S9 family peptidase [Polyangiaceae bacterium]|nr:S9 family peptidase [Polyangiaceae bacterium]